MKELFDGTMLSLGLAVLALSIGFCIAIIFTYILTAHEKSHETTHKMTHKKIPSMLINGFISFSRGVPLLLQIFLLYYGVAEFEYIKNSIFWPILKEPFWCATIVLALNSSAYTTVILSQAINAIPVGELEVCRIMNLSFFQTMRHISFPRALANIWPAYSNEAIMVLKSTSLCSTITLIDLMGATRQIIATHYRTFEMLLIAAFIYLILAWGLVKLLDGIKKLAIRYESLWKMK